jgi:hypothetical protein
MTPARDPRFRPPAADSTWGFYERPLRVKRVFAFFGDRPRRPTLLSEHSPMFQGSPSG